MNTALKGVPGLARGISNLGAGAVNGIKGMKNPLTSVRNAAASIKDKLPTSANDLSTGNIGDLAERAKDGAKNVTDKAADAVGIPNDEGNTAEEIKEAEAADKQMCNDFRDMFARNQEKYNEAVFKSLENYFETEKTQDRLSIMLGNYFGQYVRSPKFQTASAAVIEKSIGEVIKRSLNAELRKGANLRGFYSELGKVINNPRRAKGGTRSKRKPRKNTVKRRN